ncbi:MAG: hypothetical protein ACYTKD_23585 [Planctomycetota bacterium]|jgi:hypothetical protein
MRRLPAVSLGAGLLVGLLAALLAAPVAARAGEADPAKVARTIEEIKAHRAARDRWGRRSAQALNPFGRGGQPRPDRPQGEPRAAPTPPPANVTPEHVAYLEESLGEGLGGGDGKLIDMALEGLRSAGKGERGLAASLERAALAAALDYSNYQERVKIDAWTLAAKARLGDASAADVLQEWARDRGRGVDATNRHDRRAMTRSRIVPMRCAEALPCLAYLKVEGVGELAEDILRGDPAAAGAGDPRARMMSTAYGGSRLKGAMRVVLDLDREKGVGLVLSLVENDEFPVDHRAQLFAAGVEILQGDDAAQDRLTPTFGKLVDAMIAKGFDERRPDPGMMTLLNVALRWLRKRESVLEGLERLEAAMPGRMKRLVTSRVGLYRRQMGLTDKPKPDARAPWPPRPDAPKPGPRKPPPAADDEDEGTF